VRDRGIDNWQPSFEGGAGTDAELSRPHFAMADGAGNIYIADKDAHAIRKVSSDGTISTVAGTGVEGDGPDSAMVATSVALSIPNGLFALSDGTVYILDLGNNKIRRLSPAGEIATVYTDMDAIALGRGLWVSDDEQSIYYASGTRVIALDGAATPSVVATGFGDLGHVTVDLDGELVVTDRGANQVFRVDGDGTATPIAGNGLPTGGGECSPALDSALDGVRAVWFHPDGGYFVGTHEGSQVWFVDPAGTMHLVLDGRADHTHAGDGEPFDAPGPKVSEVRGVSMDATGNLIVTENDFGYVRVVEAQSQ
jgi:hypothetical protein